MIEQIKPELVERMIAFVREVGGHTRDVEDYLAAARYTSFVDDAASIVAELPAPVDPTKAMGDKVIDDLRDRGWLSASPYEYVAREASYAAIKRVRAGA